VARGHEQPEEERRGAHRQDEGGSLRCRVAAGAGREETSG
jgi:hypothetical protein